MFEPLEEKHAEIDFAALMSCRARLRRELQWGEWPPDDFTVERNRADLRRHNDEFLRGEAFAYTILSPDRERCIGCIYVERCKEIDGAKFTFWVVDEALDVEAELVTEVLRWLNSAWGFGRVLLPFRDANVRCIDFVRMSGLARWDGIGAGLHSGHRCFLSESDDTAAVRPNQ